MTGMKLGAIKKQIFMLFEVVLLLQPVLLFDRQVDIF